MSTQRDTRSATAGAPKAAKASAKKVAQPRVFNSSTDVLEMFEKYGRVPTMQCVVCLDPVMMSGSGYRIINSKMTACEECVQRSKFMPIGPNATGNISTCIPQEAAVVAESAAEHAVPLKTTPPKIACACGKTWEGTICSVPKFAFHVERCPDAICEKLKKMPDKEKVQFIAQMMSPVASADANEPPPRLRRRRRLERLSFGSSSGAFMPIMNEPPLP